MGQLDLANPKAPAKKENLSFAEFLRAKTSNTLTGKAADIFVADMVSLLTVDPSLRECDPNSLLSAGLQAQSINLSLNKQLGQAWVVAFNDRKNRRVLATFQIGYKGYIQLAIRSGYYRKLNVLPIKEGELTSYDPLNEELYVDLIQDEERRQKANTIGYYAMFEYLNGFRKCMYWSKQKMEAHAIEYSQSYKSDKAKGYNYSFWSKDFDSMACKTMLRQIISKWGVMSVEMQQAFEQDMRTVSDDGSSGEIIDAGFNIVGDGQDGAEGGEPESKPNKTLEADSTNQATDTTEPESKEIECPLHGTVVRTGVECTKCPDRDGKCPHWNS